MRKNSIALLCVAMAGLLAFVSFVSSRGRAEANRSATEGISVNALSETTAADSETVAAEPEVMPAQAFDIQVLVEGRPLEEYFARGRRYVEALEGAEYEVRVRNPFGVRVAVALSVDGLNTIDARRTTAYNASKWVINPYQTITVSGWQMSSERARRFYFTTERDSYGAKLGQTANLGVITAVFFRERRAVIVVPPPRYPRPMDDRAGSGREENRTKAAPESSAKSDGSGESAKRAEAYPAPDDESAATGIGRNMRNDVRWINMDLERSAAAEVTIRYEYREGLVRLGIIPRSYPNGDVIRRRERSTGFEDRRYSPEP